MESKELKEQISPEHITNIGDKTFYFSFSKHKFYELTLKP